MTKKALLSLLVALPLTLVSACQGERGHQSVFNSGSTSSTPSVSYPDSSGFEGTPDEVSIFSINDMHGKLDGSNGYSSIIDLDGSIKADPNYDPATSIIVSAGDSWQGSYASGYDYGKTTTILMGLLGVRVMTLGNHEFDWGLERIQENMAAANFPLICANLVDETQERPDWIESHAVISVGDLDVGFVGVIGPGLEADIKVGMLEDCSFSEDISLVAEAYQDCVTEGADTVFLIAHEDGYSSYLYELCDAIDFAGVFCGHTHQFQSSDFNGTPSVQGGSDNRGYSYMVYSTAEGEVTRSGYREVGSIPSSNQGLKDYLSWYLSSLPHNAYAQIQGYWTKQTSGNFVLSAMLYAVKVIYPDLATDHLVSVHNTGGIRGYYPQSDEPQDFTMDMIQIVSPFDNKLMLLTDRTPDYSQLRPSGYNYVSDYSCSEWPSVDIVTIDYLVNDSYSEMFSPEGAIAIQDPNRGGDYLIYNVVADYASHLDSQGIIIDSADYQSGAVYSD